MISRILKLTACTFGLFMVTACATGTTNLTLGLADDAVKPALLSEAPSTKLAIANVTDGRDGAQRDRIGDKRNGYGMVMGAVGTNEPVTDIVKDTIEKTFEANGHDVTGTDTDALKVETEVKRFWFDYKTGLVTVEFFGDVQISLKVLAPGSGEVLFEDEFKGYFSDKTGGGLSKTWTRIMDAALADLSREISLSSELMEALDEYEPSAPGSETGKVS